MEVDLYILLTTHSSLVHHIHSSHFNARSSLHLSLPTAPHSSFFTFYRIFITAHFLFFNTNLSLLTAPFSLFSFYCSCHTTHISLMAPFHLFTDAILYFSMLTPNCILLIHFSPLLHFSLCTPHCINDSLQFTSHSSHVPSHSVLLTPSYVLTSHCFTPLIAHFLRRTLHCLTITILTFYCLLRCVIRLPLLKRVV